MRGLLGFGIVLLIAGLAILAWPVIPYTSQEKAVEIGPIEVTKTTERNLVLPPLLGVAAAASGVALIALGRRRHV